MKGGQPPEEKVGIHRDHMKCAAPKLVSSVIFPENIEAMTEVLFDPKGKMPTMVDGIRYHHRQRVPSCERCVHNLRLFLDNDFNKAIKKLGAQLAAASAPSSVEKYDRAMKEFCLSEDEDRDIYDVPAIRPEVRLKPALTKAKENVVAKLSDKATSDYRRLMSLQALTIEGSTLYQEKSQEIVNKFKALAESATSIDQLIDVSSRGMSDLERLYESV